MKTIRSCFRNMLLFAGLPLLLCSYAAGDEDYTGEVCIGQTVQVYELKQPEASIAGMAIGENLSGNHLFVLDGNSKKMLQYDFKSMSGELDFAGSMPIKGARLESPRGLAYSKEASGEYLYFLDYKKQSNKTISRLYRYDLGDGKSTFIDLTESVYEIGTREVFDVVRHKDQLVISFDPSEYDDQIVRIRRGLLAISVKDSDPAQSFGWEKAMDGYPVIPRHLPGPGRLIDEKHVEASRSLTGMNTDGTDYLWGTVGSDYVYLIDGETGRGIFFFDLPGIPGPEDQNHSGMAFGAGYLWVAVPNSEEALVHRINVLNNPEIPYTGPKRFREIRMRLVSVVRDEVTVPRGMIYHTFLHPFPGKVLGHQDVIPNTIQTNDINNLSDCRKAHLFYYPAGDTAMRQDYTLVSYSADAHPEIRKYETDFSIRVWTRPYKHFIYPHLAEWGSGPEGTSYLEDDDVLYRINADPEIYPAFITRVKEYIREEYGIEPRMDNPYWASRNIMEYIKEQYHYPKDEEGYYATYDFEKGNYNSNPGNLKAELSADDSYEDNITACSGTGAMVCGALRSIGIPAVWIGVSQEQSWNRWQTEDKDEFLEFNEESVVGNGHRYNHVWLGDFYKWQRFDATPTRPDGVDFDKRPKEVSQWDIMQRSAAGVEPHRVIHTIQSEFWPKLHVAFADCEDRVNNCGATRYNLLGTYTYPEEFRFSRNIIRYRALQFINDIQVELNDSAPDLVTWKEVGVWDMDPDAMLDVVLEKKADSKAGNDPSAFEEVRTLARNVPGGIASAEVDLNDLAPGIYRVRVSKVGDPVTGNATVFNLEQ